MSIGAFARLRDDAGTVKRAQFAAMTIHRIRPELGEGLIDTAALARLFGVCPRTAWTPSFLARLGLKQLRIGRTVRYRPADVREALARIEAAAGPRGTDRSRYRVVDRRTDGTPRVVAELPSDAEARAALAALLSAGATDARLEVIDIGSADA